MKTLYSGKIYHNHELIFGPGMIDAYNSEKKLAIYPRIVLTEEILSLTEKYYQVHNGSKLEKEYAKLLVKRDFDGLYYVDYFSSAVNEIDEPSNRRNYCDDLQGKIQELSLIRDLDLKPKYLWLKEKYDAAMKDLWG
jgi:hypothetical protein